MPGLSRGSVAICARDSTWNTPIGVGASAASRRRRVVRRQVRQISDRGGPRSRALAPCSRRAAADSIQPDSVADSISRSASCSTAIMPRPSRSTLTMPMSAQSSLSHCTTTRPGMLAFSSGTTDRGAPWQITMPPECWPEVPRQVLHLLPELREVPDARAAAHPARPSASCFASVSSASLELEVVHHLRQPVDLRRVEAEHLAHFARRAPAAIGDDVGRHRRAVLAVLLVDVLDDALAPIAARQIEIDVGPLAALFGQEALEQQLHADRIDGRDAEAVADGAVGRRAAALHEDVVLAAEVDDVPDDEEVAGEIELLDEIQLALDLRARAS